MKNGKQGQTKKREKRTQTGHMKGAKRRIMLEEGSDRSGSDSSYLRGFKDTQEEEEEREGQERKGGSREM